MRIGKNRKSRNRRRALLLATALTPMCVSIGFAATNDSWTNSAGGTWDLATNWSLGVAPESNSYNAIVALVPASPYTVNIVDSFPVAAITVNSTKATVLQSAGTITTGTINLDAGTYTLGTGSNIGTIANATVNLGGGTLNIVNADLNNVAVTGGSLTVPGSYALYLQGGLAVGTLNAGNYATIYFDGNQTENNTVINSTGMNAVIKLGSPSSSSSNSTLTLGSNASLVGPFEIYNYINTGGYSLVNNGTINSNSSGNATYVETTTCINNGLAEATSGGTLEIDSTNFTNNGTLSVAAGCKLTVYSPNLVQNGTLITATGSQTSINDGTTTFSGGTVQNSGSLTITGPSTLKQTGSAVTVGGAVMVAPDQFRLAHLSGGGHDRIGRCWHLYAKQRFQFLHGRTLGGQHRRPDRRHRIGHDQHFRRQPLRRHRFARLHRRRRGRDEHLRLRQRHHRRWRASERYHHYRRNTDGAQHDPARGRRCRTALCIGRRISDQRCPQRERRRRHFSAA
jgi:hypothetical protein